MITTSKIFLNRVVSDVKFQYQVWRTVVDWTVAVYMVIPAIIFGVIQYREWWVNPPDFLSLIPLTLFINIIFLFSIKGTVRLFFDKGDQLFLWQKKNWINGIITYSLCYSILIFFLMHIVFFLLLAPFLIVHYQLTVGQLFNLFSFSYLFGACMKFARHLVVLSYVGLKQKIVNWVTLVISALLFNYGALFISNYNIWFVVSSILLLGILIVLAFKRIHFKGVFYGDIEREIYQKMKNVNFLLGFSGYDIKKPKSPRKRPLLFRSSNTLFKKRNAANALTELCIKSVLRNSKHLLQYFQLVVLCTIIIYTFPLGWKWLLWLLVPFLITSFIRYFWQEAVTSDFVKIFPWKDKDKITAIKKFMFIITLPGYLLISFVLGFQVFSWTGSLLILPIGGFVLYYSIGFGLKMILLK
ncbi:MAG: hypothetical protein FH758_14345 [Firmicutes bacterium]|nr:hypothetical protein [Bacillota bacterium]